MWDSKNKVKLSMNKTFGHLLRRFWDGVKSFQDLRFFKEASANHTCDYPFNVSQLIFFVAVAPSLTTAPSNQTVLESDEGTFQCIATGNPTPKITWTKDGMTVGSGEILRFPVSRNQSGKYWCSAENGFKATVNASAYLDVHCKWFGKICWFYDHCGSGFQAHPVSEMLFLTWSPKTKIWSPERKGGKWKRHLYCSGT